MKRDLFLLGSTGSIGKSVLKVVKNNKNIFKIKLLTTNKNVRKIYHQSIEFNVKTIVIFDKKKYLENKKKFEKAKIGVFFSIKDALKNHKSKVFLTINAISGINGLEPSIESIKFSKNLAIANKESIICGWRFIQNEMNKYNTKFIPLDSEHFSIWSLLRGENKFNIKKIYLTASGGPFLNKNLNNIKNIRPEIALKHPNWKMGQKISIDSATMMNKIFEVIEAIKIFNLNKKDLKILIHPRSYIHAIIHFKNGLIKFLAHDTTMEIPIANSLFLNSDKYKPTNNTFLYQKLNGLNFIKPSKNKFPLIKILDYQFKDTFFEVILVSINDALVNYYLDGKISYISLHKIMLKLLNKRYFKVYYETRPKDINQIKSMVKKVNQYVKKYLKIND